MLFHYQSGVPLCSFAKLAEAAEWLEAFLTAQGSAPPIGSDIARAISAAKDLPRAVPGPRPPTDLSLALGAAFLGRALERASHHRSFPKLYRLLPHLIKCNPIQNVSAPSTQSRNFVFELVVGACLLPANVDARSAAEPDLVLEEADRWNLSLKAVYSKNTITFMDRVAEATAQSLKPDDGYGVAVIGVSNLLAHDQFLPLISPSDDIWGSFPDSVTAITALEAALQPLETLLRAEAPLRIGSAAGNAAFRGVVLIAQLVWGIAGNGALLTAVALLDRSSLLGTPYLVAPELELFRRFHNVTQTLLLD